MRRTDMPAWRRWCLRACLALPIVLLLANLLAWLRWGIDLPFFDDWRAYDDGTAGSLAWRDLFAGTNNTIAPVGLALDALAQRLLGANALPYQSLSMLAVLGGLLWLQWRLLGWVARDRALQTLAFAFCFPMLQPGTYWGEQSLAYHQALPLLALFFGIWLVLCHPAPRCRGPRWSLLVLGLLAGFSYISGAVAAAVVGGMWLVLAAVLRRRAVATEVATRVRGAGAMLLLAGGVTLALQVYLTLFVPQRHEPYRGITTLPIRADFWTYLAGKIGRASGEPFASLLWEGAWVGLLVALALLAAWGAARALAAAAGRRSARRRRLALILLPCGAMVAAYLALIAAGRAGLHDGSVTGAAEVFRLGYQRFHFFWVTPLFPWTALALALRARRASRARAALGVAVALACLLGAWRGMFAIWPYYQVESGYRTELEACIAQQLGTGAPIRCSGYEHMGIPDLTRAYLDAARLHSAFVRTLPVVMRPGLGTGLLHGSADSAAVTWHSAQRGADGWMHSVDDPQMLISLAGAGPALAGCAVVGFEARMQTNEPGTAQLFYRMAGQTDYTEQRSQSVDFLPSADGAVQLLFAMDAPHGLASELRLDPVAGAGRWRVNDWRLSCLLRNPQPD